MVARERKSACYTLNLDRLHRNASQISADQLMAATTDTIQKATAAARPLDRANLFYLAAFYLVRLADEALSLGP